MRIIFFLVFIYLVIKLVRLSLVQSRAGSGAFNRTYTFHRSNPFGNAHHTNGERNIKKKPKFDNLEEAEFEEIADEDSGKKQP